MNKHLLLKVEVLKNCANGVSFEMPIKINRYAGNIKRTLKENDRYIKTVNNLLNKYNIKDLNELESRLKGE